MTKLKWTDNKFHSVVLFEGFHLYVSDKTKTEGDFEVELNSGSDVLFTHTFKAKSLADAKRLGLCTAVDWFQGLAIALQEMIPFVPMDELIDATYPAADDEPA